MLLKTDIPLILGKEAMKKSNTHIDFANDKIHNFDAEIPVHLKVTSTTNLFFVIK